MRKATGAALPVEYYLFNNNMSMCNKEETKQAAIQAINETVFQRDPKTGESRLTREIDSHIEEYINKMVAKLTFRFAFSLIGLVAVATVGWVNLSNKVYNNTRELGEGDRYTQSEHDSYAQYVDSRFDGMEDDIKEIKQDVKDIRNAVIGSGN